MFRFCKKDSLYVFVEIAPKLMLLKPLLKIEQNRKSPEPNNILLAFCGSRCRIFMFLRLLIPQIINQKYRLEQQQSCILIYGDSKQQDGKSLTLQKEQKCIFHRDANLKIGKNAQLIANGNLGKEVIFRG